MFLKKSFWSILLPFIKEFRYNLWGIPFIVYFAYISHNAELTLSLVFLVFWGPHLILNGLNYGYRSYPEFKISNPKKQLILLIDFSLAILLFISLAIFFKYSVYNGFKWQNYLFLSYLIFLNVLEVLVKIFFSSKRG